MTSLRAYLDPLAAPPTPPPRALMGAATRELHDALDARARASGVADLHPTSATVQRDLLGAAQVIAWQEGKAERLFLEEACWAELPPLYARYGTAAGARVIAEIRRLEGARAALAVDSGMQAVALVGDVLMGPGAHAIALRQVYNKSRTYLDRLARRLGGALTVVDDGAPEALAAAIRPETAMIFAETYTNPLTRAQDPARLVAIVAEARARWPKSQLRLVIDDTIATPWGLRAPLLAQGVDVVVAAGTKALAGHDRDLFGAIATDDLGLANQLMDLVAMRGGILDWRRAEVIADDLESGASEALFRRRCASASAVATFLEGHPAVAAVWHPSLASHPDAAIVRAHYQLPGSLLSLRLRGADEAAHRHAADVIAMSGIIRYALSFDGLTTKVNHHQTVSEYFTPPEALARGGIGRLIRLGVGTEDPDDLIAALNWALHAAPATSSDAVSAWQRERADALGLA